MYVHRLGMSNTFFVTGNDDAIDDDADDNPDNQ